MPRTDCKYFSSVFCWPLILSSTQSNTFTHFSLMIWTDSDGHESITTTYQISSYFLNSKEWLILFIDISSIRANPRKRRTMWPETWHSMWRFSSTWRSREDLAGNHVEYIARVSIVGTWFATIGHMTPSDYSSSE